MAVDDFRRFLEDQPDTDVRERLDELDALVAAIEKAQREHQRDQPTKMVDLEQQQQGLVRKVDAALEELRDLVARKTEPAVKYDDAAWVHVLGDVRELKAKAEANGDAYR